MPSPEGVPARLAALRILDRVLRSGVTVPSAAPRFISSLAANDRALALAIVGEVLRRLPDLDALIDGATRQRLPDDSKARMVLRLALAQKVALNTPDHAVVATALPLVGGGPRRLVHGVLGTLLRRRLQKRDCAALPADVEQRWAQAWGMAAVSAARRQILARPPLDLSFVTDEDAARFAEAHSGRSLAPRHVRLDESGAVEALSGFAEGRWWVQDLAASLPARLIPSDATSVTDLCAAPGGKTMQLAAAGHEVTSVDIAGNRLDRLRENLARTGLAAHLVEADAGLWEPEGPLDAILLDAPCSATGTFRRHPEVLHRVRPGFVREAADAQLRLLTRARDWIRPGGSIVYSVCSLEREEGEGVVGAFLEANPDFRVEPGPPIADWLRPDEQGWYRILPGLLEAEGGLDGFFAARLVRTA